MEYLVLVLVVVLVGTLELVGHALMHEQNPPWHIRYTYGVGVICAGSSVWLWHIGHAEFIFPLACIVVGAAIGTGLGYLWDNHFNAIRQADVPNPHTDK